MLKKIILAATVAVSSIGVSSAEEVTITGNVTSKCVIHTDTPGVYGNPSQSVLSTLPADGGVSPVIRYDVVQGGFYKAVITTPNSFSTSPTLNDTVAWTGLIEVGQVSDPQMSAYTTNKRVYDNTSEFDLTVSGTVWFKGTSKAEYGYNKSFPGGTYKAVISAQCIAK